MEWVYRFVHTHLHGLGKPVPLEFDRHKWCTSRNLRKYYDIIRDAALEHGLAVKNDSFVPGVPYTEEIYWTKPRPAAATGALRSMQAAHRQRPAARAQAGEPGQAGGCEFPCIQAHDPAFAIGMAVGPSGIPGRGPGPEGALAWGRDSAAAPGPAGPHSARRPSRRVVGAARLVGRAEGRASPAALRWHHVSCIDKKTWLS